MGDHDQVDFLVGEKSGFWPDKYKCPRCDHMALATTLGNTPPEMLARPGVLLLEAEELFAALNGLGLPEERVATKEVLEQLLLKHMVVNVRGETLPGTKRCRIDWLDLVDGSRVFFAAGGKGAVVYRIRKRHSYTENIDGESNA
jgi:hypothetical protein